LELELDAEFELELVLEFPNAETADISTGYFLVFCLFCLGVFAFICSVLLLVLVVGLSWILLLDVDLPLDALELF
jgi:hypothetical protein